MDTPVPAFGVTFPGAAIAALKITEIPPQTGNTTNSWALAIPSDEIPGWAANSGAIGFALLNTGANSLDWRVRGALSSVTSATPITLNGGGTIAGAAFLQAFVGDTPWAHLDIAGVSRNRRNPDLGATGFGVRLLVEAVRRWPAARAARAGTGKRRRPSR